MEGNLNRFIRRKEVGQMNLLGTATLHIYSLILVSSLLAVWIKKCIQTKGKDFKCVFLIPIFLYLINL